MFLKINRDDCYNYLMKSMMHSLDERGQKALLAAYYPAPWGFVLDPHNTDEYFKELSQDSRWELWTYRENAESAPYLYIGLLNYSDDMAELIDIQLAGANSFLRAKDENIILSALSHVKNAVYITDLWADKSVAIPVGLKPRLKLFPEIIADIFAETGCENIVFYTHHSTAVYEACRKLSNKYTVEITSYTPMKPPTDLNENYQINQLELVVIAPKVR